MNEKRQGSFCAVSSHGLEQLGLLHVRRDGSRAAGKRPLSGGASAPLRLGIYYLRYSVVRAHGGDAARLRIHSLRAAVHGWLRAVDSGGEPLSVQHGWKGLCAHCGGAAPTGAEIRHSHHAGHSPSGSLCPHARSEQRLYGRPDRRPQLHLPMEQRYVRHAKGSSGRAGVLRQSL